MAASFPRTWNLPLLLLVASLAAACTDAPTGTSASDPAAAQAPVDETLAILRAVVLGVDLVPIANAQVVVDELTPALTDEAGAATIHNIQPGPHRVIVQAIGFQAVGRSVDLAASETTEERFLLDAVPIDDVRTEFTIAKGKYCVGATVMGVYAVYSTPCADAKVFLPFAVEADIVTVVTELVWTATSGVTSKEFRFSLEQGGSESGVIAPAFSYGSVLGTSPLSVRADAPFAGIKADAANTLKSYVAAPTNASNPPNVNVIYDQAFTVYTTEFYGAPAPDGYSGRPDA